ncbi:MAG TPA: zinc-binding alcohol dehydrogenase family protein [Bryobacteraceae bacterium]|jgi:NADPH:quinone reductase-like Zn-dependent oxidoreductase|nr:zinc-binding alcohol dehydrogenase family protein [Bryobacteraceae bacterium]
MLAARFHRFGTPDQLTIEDIPAPDGSGPGAIVRVVASGINPSDAKNVQGRFAQTTLPRTPGRDFAGVVVEASNHKWVGRHVFGSGGEFGCTRDGAHSELIYVPESALCRKPDNMSFEQAGCIGAPYVTAWLAIQKADVKPGETVAVIGAAGAVGSAAVQIARWRGARVIGVEQGSRREAAADVICANEKSAAACVRALTGGSGADVCIDAAGLASEGLQALARGGRMIVIAAPANPRVAIDMLAIYRSELQIAGIDPLKLDGAHCGEILRSLAPGFESGALWIEPKITTFPLERIVEAYSAVLYHSVQGRCVVIPAADSRA